MAKQHMIGFDQLGVDFRPLVVDPHDGWGVAGVERRDPMVRGGLTTFELHWYRAVAERRYGPDRYHRLGSIFVTSSGIFVRDDTLNMVRLPLARWQQMNAAWAALRLGKNVHDMVESVVTHRWVRRPEEGGAQLMRDHLDPIISGAGTAGAEVEASIGPLTYACEECTATTILTCVHCGRHLCARHSAWNKGTRGHGSWIGNPLVCTRTAETEGR